MCQHFVYKTKGHACPKGYGVPYIGGLELKWLYKKLSQSEGPIIKYSYTAFRFWFYRRAKERNYKDLTIYHYRRNFVQYHADKNVPLPKLALMTGHKSYSMLARYYGYIGLRN